MYLATALKCRTPGSRDPSPEETAACEPFLYRQLELVQPRVVASLGSFATTLLSGRAHGITRVHGQEQEVTLGGRSVTLVPLYHPAAALYTPTMLEVLERDVARLGEILGRPQVQPSLSTAGAGRDDEAGLARAGPTRPLLAVPGVEVVSGSPEETEALAGRLARRLVSGDVVLVSGELGTGKTTFVRGACRALGVTGRVTSPSFTIGHRYPGSPDVSHLDLYRFHGLSTAEWGDLEPYFDEAVVFVEWPEAGSGTLPAERVGCASSTSLEAALDPRGRGRGRAATSSHRC